MLFCAVVAAHFGPRLSCFPGVLMFRHELLWEGCVWRVSWCCRQTTRTGMTMLGEVVTMVGGGLCTIDPYGVRRGRAGVR